MHFRFVQIGADHIPAVSGGSCTEDVQHVIHIVCKPFWGLGRDQRLLILAACSQWKSVPQEQASAKENTAVFRMLFIMSSPFGDLTDWPPSGHMKGIRLVSVALSGLCNVDVSAVDVFKHGKISFHSLAETVLCRDI